jgi:RimJ/RimL family protein N-acetyltransferase
MLQTPRLILRPWADDDTELLVRLGALPEITRFISDGATWTPDRARESSDRALAHWRDHGFGWRPAVERESGTPVGFISLNYGGDDPPPGLKPEDFEIGWWIDPAHWGRGYATEGATAMRDHALSDLRAPGLVARIQPDNAASLKVAERIGLERAGETIGRSGEPVVLLRLSVS